MDRVVVCGGGLAGLVAARHLAERGVEVTLFESEAVVGGRVRSRERDGFTLDRGFQVLFTSYPAARRELSLDALDLRQFSPGAVLCSTGDGTRSVLADPLRDPGSAVESALNRRVSFGDKLRTLRLRWETTRRSPESFFTGEDRTIREELARRGFSHRYVENFVAPFYGGITLDRSLRSSKHLFEYTFRCLSQGAAAVPADGMGAIPAQLADRAREAGATVRTETTVERVTPHATDGASAAARSDPGDTASVTVETGGETITADGAVVATDPRTARALTGVDAIPSEWNSSTTQYYALPEPGVPGRKIHLHTDGRSPNVVVPHSSVAPEYAPDGQALVAATFPGERALDRDAAALAADTRRVLDAWYPERSFDRLEPVHTDRVRFAQFAQPPGFYRSLPEPSAPDGPIVLAGDYTEWSSIQGAMESGRRAVDALLG